MGGVSKKMKIEKFEKGKKKILPICIIVALIILIAFIHTIKNIGSDEKIASIIALVIGITACEYLCIDLKKIGYIYGNALEFIFTNIAFNCLTLEICIFLGCFVVGACLAPIVSIIIAVHLMKLYNKRNILNKKITLLSIKIYLNFFIFVGTIIYEIELEDSIYPFVLVLTGEMLFINIKEFKTEIEEYRKRKITIIDHTVLKQIKATYNFKNKEDKKWALYNALDIPIICGIQEFPTSSHNIDCEEKLYDKFGNCNKKEMYTYWIRKHRQCFEQICKNKNIELRDLCEMLFMLYDVITEDGVKKDSDINIRIDRDFNVQIEKLSVSNRELCDAMCSAAEEFLKEEEIEIIPWNELICDNRETEDRIKISAITSRK